MNDDKKDVMREYADEIYSLEKTVAEKKMLLKNIQGDLVKIELKTYVVVCTEKNDDGKPKFSNEKLREAEVKFRLSEDKEYTELTEKYDEETFNLSLSVSDVDLKKRYFRIEELNRANNAE